MSDANSATPQFAYGKGQQTWLDTMNQKLAGHTSGQRYFNYIDKTSAAAPDALSAYFGASVPRLRAVKAAYDPHGRIGEGLDWGLA